MSLSRTLALASPCQTRIVLFVVHPSPLRASFLLLLLKRRTRLSTGAVLSHSSPSLSISLDTPSASLAASPVLLLLLAAATRLPLPPPRITHASHLRRLLSVDACHMVLQMGSSPEALLAHVTLERPQPQVHLVDVRPHIRRRCKTPGALCAHVGLSSKVHTADMPARNRPGGGRWEASESSDRITSGEHTRPSVQGRYNCVKHNTR